jgi:ribosomal peptide maturation radical SAM protein 1
MRSDVVLVSMPYPPLHQPSMALGLLKASLRRAGISVTSLYPCLWLAEEIGLDVYSFICESKQEFLAGEWTFAGAAFPDFTPDHEAYLDRFFSAPVSAGLMKRAGFSGNPREALVTVRELAPAFVDRVARAVLAREPRIVGCTSTFMQHVPSLALLRRIRELAPDVITMIGGANCEGEMGAAAKRTMPWIDYVVSGEADLLLPELCRRLLDEGRAARDLPFGVIAEGHTGEAPRVSVHDMDRTPVPDFDDFFAAIAESTLRPFLSPGLAVETSRGCWWGKVHHCTFCGLNGGNMEFRSKSPDRVVSELAELSGRYGIRKFNVVDNILDLAYLRTVLPRLAASESEPYTLFFETKSNLRREQLETIAAAGIRRLQPGIESMHDEVLRLIDKGTTAMQNVRLLKWARELGVFITWNFLWDVPGEQEEWYAEMASWLPLVAHLQPPGVDRMQFHRFSPYHFRSGDFALQLEPHPLYAYVYPFASELANLAYYFHEPARRPVREELARRPHLQNVMRRLGEWNRAWGQGGFSPREAPVLLMDDDGEVIEIADTRPCAVVPSLRLEGLDARVYRACSDGQTPATLRSMLSGDDAAAIDASIATLEARKLLLRQGERRLALATRQLTPIPDGEEDFPGGFTAIGAWRTARMQEQT